MLIEEGLNELKNNFLDDVRKTINQDKDSIMNNLIFDEQYSKRNLLGGKHIKNLRRRNLLYYFKKK